MNLISLLYYLLSGPCLFITVSICIAGILRKSIIIVSGRRNGMVFPVLSVQQNVGNSSSSGGFPLSAAVRNRSLFIISLLFHLALFTAPLTAAAHWILFDVGWNIMMPEIPYIITGVSTIAVIAAGVFLALRRIIAKHVLAVSSWRDFFLMGCVLLPFITGYLARKNVGLYEVVILVHCISAHIFIIALGWTRLGHFVFFTVGRLAIYGFRREDNAWIQ